MDVCASVVVTSRAKRKKARKKKIEEENGGKMTRYGVCLILERGEVSLPEGPQHGMSLRWCIFFCQSCAAATYTSVFLVTQGFQRHQQEPDSRRISCDGWHCLS